MHLNGSINKQTIRYWLADKPIELHLNLLTVLNTPACMQLTVGTVAVGPSFFDEDDVTKVRNFLQPHLKAFGIIIHGISYCFKKCGATAHISNASMAVVWRNFPQYLISRLAYLHWPASTPNMFFCELLVLWDQIK